MMTSRQIAAGGERPRRGARLPRGVIASVVGSLIILAILMFLAFRLIQRTATSVALDDAAQLASGSVTLALAPFLTEDLVALDPAAQTAVNDVGEALMRQGPITHIKIWSLEGTVLWSDETPLIGKTFELDESERAVFGLPEFTAEVSNLDKIENGLELASGSDRLLEVYVGSRTAAGTPLVVEVYAPYELVTQRAEMLRRQFMPLMAAALIVLATAQLLLVLFLGRRLTRFERRQSELLKRLVETSDEERRRVAAQVHDGVVQDLIGISFGLAALAESGPKTLPVAAERKEQLAEMASSTRAAVASLRSLLGSIYPVEVPPEGWVAGIQDLVDMLGQLGVDVQLDVEGVRLIPMEELLVLRVAREALRNVAAHAHASEVVVRLAERKGRIVCSVSDDGSGFDPSSREDGHIGLRLIHDIIRDAGGQLNIESTPADGTTLSFELELAH